MHTFTSFAEEGSSSVWQNEGALKEQNDKWNALQKKKKRGPREHVCYSTNPNVSGR